jgi:hypothetical protein
MRLSSIPAAAGSHRGRRACLLAAALVLQAQAVDAADECRYRIELRDTGAGRELAAERRLSVGEIDRQAVPSLARLRNLGPLDIRATFDGAAPRVLARAQVEPTQGTFGPAVALRSVECLAMKSAGAPAAGESTRVLVAAGVAE